jgi:hypothetical protein
MPELSLDEKVETAANALDAGFRFLNHQYPDGRQYAPLLLTMKESAPGRTGSSGAAEYRYFHEAFGRAFDAAVVRWQDFMTGVEEQASVDLKRGMVGSFMDGEFRDLARAAYDASTPLVAVLSDDRKAPKIIAQNHLNTLNEFRTGLEPYLGITRGHEVAGG